MVNVPHHGAYTVADPARAGGVGTSRAALGAYNTVSIQATRESAAAASSAPFVPWAAYAARLGLLKGAGKGQGTSMLAPPLQPPAGWFPSVHGMGGERTELAKRGLEATRIASALSQASVARMVDASWQAICKWPAGVVAATVLDAICASGGHSRIAVRRQHLVSLDEHLRAVYGYPRLAVMHEEIGASQIRTYLQERDREALERARLTRLRKAQRDQSITGDADDAVSGGSAAAALSALESANNAYHLKLHVEHPSLQQFRGRPPTREDAGAESPEPLLDLHLELIAADTSQNQFVRGVAAMARCMSSACLRKALGCRGLTPKVVSDGTAIGPTGKDLKKGRWSVAGRPFIVQVHGVSGDSTWFRVLRDVLELDGFNSATHSLLRAHNGAAGDPTRATAWLPRECTTSEWNASLQACCNLHAHMRDAHGRMVQVSPHLLATEGGSIPNYTGHSLKQIKPDLYSALLLHTDYIVEAGAHAGSELERLSMRGAMQYAKEPRPSGLATALRYARGARSQSVVEVDKLAYATIRAWIAEVGIEKLPRERGWAELTAWVSKRIQSGREIEYSQSLIPIRAWGVENIELHYG